jgi:hypothetical protein
MPPLLFWRTILVPVYFGALIFLAQQTNPTVVIVGRKPRSAHLKKWD